MAAFARISGLLAVSLALSACVTTADVGAKLQADWIGQPSDRFFSRYGPPSSSFKLGNGGQIYTWRGGQTVRHVPADYQIIRHDPFFMAGPGGPPGRPMPPPPFFGDPEVVMVSPPRDESLVCQAEITVDRGRIIRAIHISGDTDGQGLSMSRCADVFGVAKSR